MKKRKIIEEINKLNLEKNEFWILGSAALVLRDIIDEANDIDIAISNKLYQKLKNNITYLGTNHNSKWYKINDKIECCIEDISKDKVEITNPFNLIDLTYYYNTFIKDSNREKDKEKKEILEKILSKNQKD